MHKLHAMAAAASRPALLVLYVRNVREVSLALEQKVESTIYKPTQVLRSYVPFRKAQPPAILQPSSARGMENRVNPSTHRSLKAEQ